MPESVAAWWARRQWSKGVDVPYPIGTFRPEWERYPVLVRQYHPDLNDGITLTQVPPAADVYLLWLCDAGHRFVATPQEQRSRPGGSRRRSTWCPECAALAVNRPLPSQRTARSAPRTEAAPDSVDGDVYRCGHPRDPLRIECDPGDDRCYLCRRLDSAPLTRDELVAMAAPRSHDSVMRETGVTGRHRWLCPVGHGSFQASIEQILGGRRCPVCRHARAAAEGVAVGEAFRSPWAPKPASAAEPDLRRRLESRLTVNLDANAVRVARPFFRHIEVWPDLVIPELRVAIEYDTTGRDGLEHVGRREDTDRRKDRLLRAVGWEVIRIRCGKLQPIGPFDLTGSGVSDTLIVRLLDRLGEIRGALIVAAYTRSDHPGESSAPPASAAGRIERPQLSAAAV